MTQRDNGDPERRGWWLSSPPSDTTMPDVASDTAWPDGGIDPTNHAESPGGDGSEAVDRDTVTLIRQAARFNFGDMIGTQVIYYVGHMLDYDDLSPKFLAITHQVFAEPDGFAQLYANWRRPGSIVVLDRAANTGRTTVGYALLARLCQALPHVRPSVLRFGGSTNFSVRRLPREEDRAYLLELPPDEDGFAVSDTFGADLEDLARTLEQRQSWAVILTNPVQWTRIRRGAPASMTAELGEMNASAIARRWLAAEASGVDIDRWLGEPDIQRLLAGRTPADALDIVDLIIRMSSAPARDLVDLAGNLPEDSTGSPEHVAAGDDLFPRRVASVVAARDNWYQQILKWQTMPGRTSFERDFLLSAAALRDSPVSEVYLKSAALEHDLGGAEVNLLAQSAPGVIELVSKAHATLRHDDRIEFHQPGWDDAVLEYFWVDRPLARKKFLAWLAKAPFPQTNEALENISNQQRIDLARRVAVLALRWTLRQERPAPLVTLAETWHGKDQWQVFVDTLTNACLQPESAGYLHPLLLDWAKSKNTVLQLAVVAACAGEFGRRNPAKALRRLQHAARSVDQRVAANLRTAVTTLWEDKSVRPTLLTTVVKWCTDRSTIRAGRWAFSILVTTISAQHTGVPALLVGEDDIEVSTNDLITGWGTLLSGDNEIDAAVAQWLSAALDQPACREQVVEVLRSAILAAGATAASDSAGANAEDIADSRAYASADGREPPRDRMRAAIRRWAREPDGDQSSARHDLYRQISSRIDDDMIGTFQHQRERFGGEVLA